MGSLSVPCRPEPCTPPEAPLGIPGGPFGHRRHCLVPTSPERYVEVDKVRAGTGCVAGGGGGGHLSRGVCVTLETRLFPPDARVYPSWLHTCWLSPAQGGAGQ